MSLLTVLLATSLVERTAAQLTVASVTPDPAPSGSTERLTLHMEGVTEAHLDSHATAFVCSGLPMSVDGTHKHWMDGRRRGPPLRMARCRSC